MRENQDSQLSQSRQPPSRRALLAGAGVACAAMLAGCGSNDAGNGGPAPTAGGTVTSAASGAPAASGSTAADSTATDSAHAAGALAAISQVPDGGGLIIDGKNIVITQPQSGSFRAFSAICTHEGCILNSIANGTINCPCHGSKFSIINGSVVHGPALSPLAAIAIKVEGTSIFQG